MRAWHDGKGRCTSGVTKGREERRHKQQDWGGVVWWCTTQRTSYSRVQRRPRTHLVPFWLPSNSMPSSASLLRTVFSRRRGVRCEIATMSGRAWHTRSYLHIQVHVKPVRFTHLLRAFSKEKSVTGRLPEIWLSARAGELDNVWNVYVWCLCDCLSVRQKWQIEWRNMRREGGKEAGKETRTKAANGVSVRLDYWDGMMLWTFRYFPHSLVTPTAPFCSLLFSLVCTPIDSPPRVSMWHVTSLLLSRYIVERIPSLYSLFLPKTPSTFLPGQTLPSSWPLPWSGRYSFPIYSLQSLFIYLWRACKLYLLYGPLLFIC